MIIWKQNKMNESMEAPFQWTVIAPSISPGIHQEYGY